MSTPDEHELIAPVAARNLRGSRLAGQQAGDPLQDRISHGVPERVVDVLG